MATYGSEIRKDRERRRADLERLDELYIRLLGLGGVSISDLGELNEKLDEITVVIRKAYAAGISIEDMLGLMDTGEVARELVLRVPKVVLNDEAEDAYSAIWESILSARKALVRATEMADN